ncbi:ras association domain-containing protein 2-like [Tubulanus polymorphus]|uniref:ras association domain-containing protein 2-like n=1 Tax=Tubulanus polymorphus TaxID=672921 RepID=UPI003DA1D9DE
MSTCQKCGKPVYFAERKTSLGKEWHRQCLRCEECGKVLNPGQHAEHKGLPYCHRPCYQVLFGPHITGYGVAVVANSSFGSTYGQKEACYTVAGLEKEDLQNKLDAYNSKCGQSGQLSYKEVNGRLLFEGLLRLHWGVKKQIYLKQKDDIPVRRKSFVSQDDDDVSYLRKESLENGNNGSPTSGSNTMKVKRSVTSPASSQNGEVIRRRYRTTNLTRNRKNRCSINGHLYDFQTSVFTPTYGSISSVRVTSANTVPEVIKTLLEKFKVINRPNEFGLFVVNKNGDIQPIHENQYPLLESVILGPNDVEAKVFIMEKNALQEITQELANYVSLPEAMLEGFLNKFKLEEEAEIDKIKRRYAEIKEILKDRLREFNRNSRVTESSI